MLPSLTKMPHIAPIPTRDFEKFLKYIGCVYKRQKGSHRVYWRAGLNRPIIVPIHNKLPVMVIRTNLRTLNITPEQYLEILSKI